MSTADNTTPEPQRAPATQADRASHLGPAPRTQHWRSLGFFGTLLTRIGAFVTRKRNLGVFATIGRAPRLFRGWLHYSATMMPFGYLSRKESESIILRVAYLRGNAYETDQHRVIARRAGLSADTIDAIQSPHPPTTTAREAAMMAVTTELVETRKLTDATYADLAAQLKDRELVAFVMLVTQYDGLATTLDALGVPVDESR